MGPSSALAVELSRLVWPEIGGVHIAAKLAVLTEASCQYDMIDWSLPEGASYDVVYQQLRGQLLTPI